MQERRLSRGLEGARLSLTATGTFADSEVIQLLEELNAELQHTSTLMDGYVANVFKLDRDLMTLGPEQQATVNRASESIGLTLVQSFSQHGLMAFQCISKFHSKPI